MVIKYILIIFLIITVYFCIKSTYNYTKLNKEIDINLPSFKQIYVDTQVLKNKQVGFESFYSQQYILKANEFSNKYLSEYGKSLLLNNLETIENKYRIKYIDGLEQVINDETAYCQLNNLKEKDCNEIFETSINKYYLYFVNNIKEREYLETKRNIEQLKELAYIYAYIFIFILIMVLILLVRIEENTRK